jgi:hypothetical protein
VDYLTGNLRGHWLSKGSNKMSITTDFKAFVRAASCTFVLVAGMALGTAASASTIVGQLDFGGVWHPIDAGGADASLATATGVRFDASVYPITLALGIFSHLDGQNVSIVTQEFQFTGPFPFILWTADSDSVQFRLEGITVTEQDANELSLRGDGTIFVDGQSSDGRYLFTGQGALGFTFSSSSVARVPEPTALALIGLGLVAFAVMRRRRIAL